MVVLFHWSHVKGGFTGVDLFFVISGYLISGHILRDLSEERFSFAAFYAKRTRRIIPSLIVILSFAVAVGWFWSFTPEFRLIGRHVQSGALFVSNFRLYGESGYFDNAAETKPLLHLWSLAIEEQFYLIWPLLLWVSFKLFKRAEYAVSILILGSFAANIYLSTHNSEMDFYLLPSRLWELAAGGAVYLTQDRLRKFYDSGWVQSSALALIFYGFFRVSGQQGYPGVKALIPVVGAGLLLGASEGAVISRKVLSTRVLGFFGTISYTLYLWHWSLYSFMKTLVLNDAMILLSVLTLGFSYLTHRFIEKPLMKYPVTKGNRVRITTLGIGALLVLAGVGTLIGNGVIPGRLKTSSLPDLIDHRTGLSCGINGDSGQPFNAESFKPCEAIRFPGAPVVLFLGDSHAGSLNDGMAAFASENHFNLVSMNAIYCVPLSVHDRREVCNQFNRYVEEWIKKVKPDLVVFDSYYLFWHDNDGYLESQPYQEFVRSRLLEFKKWTAREVLMVGENPTWHISLSRVLNVAFLGNGLPVPERTYIGISKDSLEWDQIMRDEARAGAIPYFSIKDQACNSEGCLVRVGDRLESDLMDYDYGHLTHEGSLFIVKNGLGAKIKELLRK